VEEEEMSPEAMVVTVVGAGGKMGMRVSANLERSAHTVFYCESYPPAQDRVRAAGRQLSDTQSAAARSDVVVLAVPDVLLGQISESIVPSLSPGTILLTLDPAAAYAGVLATRPDVHIAVAHPCHPSIFLERKTDEEWADTFGGVAAPQDVVAALESGDGQVRERAESVVRTIYGPVLDVHWVTVKQLAVLEPTLVETVTCMISGLLNEALSETVNSLGVPEPAARAMLFGHAQVALTNSLRGSNPFSEACLIAMDYGHRTVINEDWKKIFDDSELDELIARMLHIDSVRRQPVVEATEALN
jgi:D-apionate oxidoisomerase